MTRLPNDPMLIALGVCGGIGAYKAVEVEDESTTRLLTRPTSPFSGVHESPPSVLFQMPEVAPA